MQMLIFCLATATLLTCSVSMTTTETPAESVPVTPINVEFLHQDEEPIERNGFAAIEENGRDRASQSLGTGGIVALAVGCVGLVSVTAVLAVFLVHRQRKKADSIRFQNGKYYGGIDWGGLRDRSV